MLSLTTVKTLPLGFYIQSWLKMSKMENSTQRHIAWTRYKGVKMWHNLMSFISCSSDEFFNQHFQPFYDLSQLSSKQNYKCTENFMNWVNFIVEWREKFLLQFSISNDVDWMIDNNEIMACHAFSSLVIIVYWKCFVCIGELF